MSGTTYGTEIDINKVETVTKVKKFKLKYGKVQTIETKKRDPFIPPVLIDKLKASLPKMRVITPTDIALKNDIRISAVKKLLNDLEKEGKVELVSSTRRLKIYKGKEAK
ncbi:MAG: hypothetical protein ACTSRZ_19645 [Promethearchaeota archaeon]